MLVEETRKVVYGSKTQGKDIQVVEGKLWNISKDCNAEKGLEDLAEGVDSGVLGEWKYVRRAIRQGLRIQCRDRILAENGIIALKAAGKRVIEQAIMAWASVNDTEAWVQVCQRGHVAIDAYYEQAINDMQELQGVEALSELSVPNLMTQVRASS